MTGILPLLLVAQAQAHLQLQVLLLLAVVVAAAEPLQALLVGQVVQVAAVAHLLLVTAVQLLRLGKEMLVDRIAPMEAVEAVLERLVTLMGKVKAETEQLLLFQVLQ
jgi:hypothetical protein